MNSFHRILSRQSKPLGPPKLEYAARAKRARDHLARKRERERLRLERERHRQEIETGRMRALAVLGPILVLLAVVGGVVAAAPLSERLFMRGAPLKEIAIQGARNLSPQAIAAGAGALAGRALDTIDPETVGKAIAVEPWIASVRSLRLPTGTLVVAIVERQAVARWHRGDATTIELVDERGTRFSGDLAPGGPLPLVRGEADLSEELPPEALEILRELKRYAALSANSNDLTLHLPADTATDEDPVSASGYVLEFGDAGPRALLGRQLFSQRVARLAALLDEEEAMVQSAQLIDLRYADRAVLRAVPASG